jgi:hypothetical protein
MRACRWRGTPLLGWEIPRPPTIVISPSLKASIHEAKSPYSLVKVRVGLGRGAARVVLELVEDGCWLAGDDGHQD